MKNTVTKCNRVIATSNPSLPLPQLTIQAIEIIVKYNGKIENFNVEFDTIYEPGDLHNIEIADIIFPNVHLTIQDLLDKYPVRPESVVTRVAPSPTGFMHLGNFYSGLIANKFATQNDGIFFIRIEDTDQKRLTE